MNSPDACFATAVAAEVPTAVKALARSAELASIADAIAAKELQ
jgi:hypothetical protein